MRLLHTTSYQLETFLGSDIPVYAILSHTWGADEFVFEDLKIPISDQLQKPKRGLRKVFKACALAVEDGFDYIWIDTCCIDKSSSAELSEAINSMFKWYRKASQCYVWLEDVDALAGEASLGDDFENSNWFRRGWTLQELIAPHEVTFYDSSWTMISDRFSLADRLSKMTGIKKGILRRRHDRDGDQERDRERYFRQRSKWAKSKSKNPIDFDASRCHFCRDDDRLEHRLWTTPVAMRMSWAAERRTSRAEDEAYCLLGLFDVNMPLLYGEGRKKAFRRLLTEILQQNKADSSILMWQTAGYFYQKHLSCLAQDLGPRNFSNIPDIRSNPLWPRPELMVTPRGLEVSVYLASCTGIKSLVDPTENMKLAVLSPTTGDESSTALGIFVTPVHTLFGENETFYTVYARTEPDVTASLAEDADGYALVGLQYFRGKFFKNKGRIRQDDFVMTRIILSLNEIVTSSATPTALIRVDARNCGAFSIHTISPPVKNLKDQRSSVLHFDDLGSDQGAHDAVVMAFSTDDRSSGFFVIWRSGTSEDDGAIAVTPWPALAGKAATCPGNTIPYWPGRHSWVDKFHRALSKEKGSVKNEKPALIELQHTSTTFSCLPELNARAMIIRQSFLGNTRFRLLVEVGPAVPETEALWAEKGVEIPEVEDTKKGVGSEE
ncbi:heterokaryon incompatibility protein-domain-containing protein [Plectosphaerella plurivora]|uniref:Heterokaryon incompatibility protein-domain-containing protein n=1 Tax=Plectosphaerella plurivora TaxID=936078 RepID=A0A9P8UZR9_9PEZI|nr:heterokaryon incompatibility protein-domain-containing protein [Plectosphaerella plurivora]